jgi:hypothetical protein
MAIVKRKLSPYEQEYYNKQNKQQEAIWAQQQKEAQQGLDTAKWTQGYQTAELKRNVGTNVINRGVARGNIGSGMIAQGMTPITQQYQQSLQTYNNWLAQNGLDRAAWAIQQWANTHKNAVAKAKASPAQPQWADYYKTLFETPQGGGENYAGESARNAAWTKYQQDLAAWNKTYGTGIGVTVK